MQPVENLEGVFKSLLFKFKKNENNRTYGELSRRERVLRPPLTTQQILKTSQDRLLRRNSLL
jgi:hypothetical protein